MREGENEVAEHLRALFVGVAPERTQELEEFWARFGPLVQIVPDDEQGEAPVMEAGMYRYLRFNHRILRMIWLLGFSAWEGYVMIHNGAKTGQFGDAAERFKAALDVAIEIGSAKDPLRVRLPDGVPEPGPTDSFDIGSTARAAGEIATFAVGWAFLHEVQHLVHQQKGTAGSEDPKDRHIEELSCDEFATRFLLERVGDYATGNNVSKEKVLCKRQLGIYFALYAMAVISREKWEASSTHPAIQTRIDQALRLMHETGFSKGAAVLASASFAALQAVLKNVPSPLTAIADLAVAEKWTVDSFVDLGLAPPISS